MPLNPVVPEGLGVNIHFTDAKPGEMKMLAEAGFTWVRMDLSWGGTERKKGEYDFSAFDRLLKSLDEHKIRALLILDYHNRFYDNGLSPHSDEGRQAMARWAAAAVKHFQGRGVIWEMYNEPNIHFWKPKPNPPDYVKLALEVGKAIRAVAPEEFYFGPATSQIDVKFLEECFKGGLLEYWDAVSVHPYRQKAPETAPEEYAKLRRLIAQYAPKGKKIPILSGEWGYSAAWKNFDAQKQGVYLPRQWLVNMSQDVPISIWYDWHDDGRDPKEAEHNFGTVKNEYFKDRDPVYDAKPTYIAAKTLADTLRGFKFNKRLAQGEADDYCLLFAKDKDVRLAVWTADAKKSREMIIPASAGKFQVVDYLGKKLPPLDVDKNGLKVTLTDTVQYLIPEQTNELLQVAAAWNRVPLEVVTMGRKHTEVDLGLQNPLPRLVQIAFDTNSRPSEYKSGERISFSETIRMHRGECVRGRIAKLYVDGGEAYVQLVLESCINPIALRFIGPANKMLYWRLENPAKDGYLGNLEPLDAVGLSIDQAALKPPLSVPGIGVDPQPTFRAIPIRLAKGRSHELVALPLLAKARPFFRLGWGLRDELTCHDMLEGPDEFLVVKGFDTLTVESIAASYQLHTDGDAKVRSTQSVSLAQPPDGPLAPGMAALKIAYDFDPGWKFIRLAPKADDLKKVEGKPNALQMWVYGDGSGNRARMRVIDSTGQVFQPDGGAIDWKGWRQVVMRLTDEHIGHWGGKNDGVIHWPIRLDTLFLLDSAQKQKTAGDIYLAAPLWVE